MGNNIKICTTRYLVWSPDSKMYENGYYNFMDGRFPNTRTLTCSECDNEVNKIVNDLVKDGNDIIDIRISESIAHTDTFRTCSINFILRTYTILYKTSNSEINSEINNTTN